VLNVLAFRDAERLPRALLTVLPFVLFLGLYLMPHAPASYDAAAYAGMVKLSAFSVASLCVVLPYILADARAKS
jgi:hypothetical protein